MALPVNPQILDAPTTDGPTVTAAPWTDDQVANLNRYQRAGIFHPFTCGWRDTHRDNPGVLVAERDGWHCPAAGCSYRQTWALPFMAAPPTSATRRAEAVVEQMRAWAGELRACLLHEDIHAGYGIDCMRAYARWLTTHRPLVGRPAREAYALEVEARILDQLVRRHAPARLINPALSKPALSK
jgi:hypothetical protein